METLAFEVQYGIDHVLQHAWPGDGSFLGDVTDDEDRDIARFRPLHQPARAFPHLGYAAGRGGDVFEHHRLDRVNHHHGGGDPFDCGEDCVEIRFGEDQDVIGRDPQPIGPELDLLGGFFSGNVHNRVPVGPQESRRLKNQGRLADAWIAADKHERPPDETASEHAVEFADRYGHALFAVKRNCRQWLEVGALLWPVSYTHLT